MKFYKILCISLLCLAIAFCAACSGKDDDASSSATSSVNNKYSYAVGDFNNTETTKISDFLNEERGAVYKDDSTGEDGFKLHYTPKYTVRKDGVRYTVVIVTMDVINFETGNVLYVSEVGAYAINDEHTEIYQAALPINGKIEVDFSTNLKK